MILILLVTQMESPASLQKRSAAENKNIVVYFCGSDWCTICHQFKARVLNEPEVDSLLQQKFIYYTADFPQRKKLAQDVIITNEYLADKLNKDGAFPKMVITDEQFKIKAIVPTDAAAATVLNILQKHIK